MRKRVYIALLAVLLAVGAVICAVRWQAWFVIPDEPHWTGDTLQGVFHTPNEDNDSIATILVLGDIHSRLTRTDYDTLAARVPDADLVMQAGDWMERGQEYYRQLLLREWTNSALNGLPVIACPGNHEYTKGVHKSLSAAWSETFLHPANGPVGVPGASYWLDIPQMRIIAIDTNPLSHVVYLTRTLTWLREAMYSAGDRAVVVIMHHPVLSAAKGRVNPAIYGTFRHALGQADLVIAGHDHLYARRTPFVMLNTAGRIKKQKKRLYYEVCDSVPVYGVLTNSQLTIHRMSDGVAIDSIYVKHD
ncbi:MAG: metallophosphoesterase [Paludibacteraceae bacterium]|nr:metallophosphoesterase [Paludibacteraceae bacterium]